MAKFTVSWTELWEASIEIEAETAEEAAQIVDRCDYKGESKAEFLDRFDGAVYAVEDENGNTTYPLDPEMEG